MVAEEELVLAELVSIEEATLAIAVEATMAFEEAVGVVAVESKGAVVLAS